MPAYIVLMKLTTEGARAAKDIPARIDEGIKAFESMGGTNLTFHVTMGPYDYVAVGEAPADEVAAAFALALASRGFVTTTTMKAFTPQEIGAIVSKLP
ncbi:MAG: GYD domain-containing protein [Actinomycetes bacterium]